MIGSKLFFLLIFLLNLSFVEAKSRISFSRPGKMIRIPSVDRSAFRKLLDINLSHEFLSSFQGNSNFSINFPMGKLGYQYGISIVKPENPINSVEIGFHVQKNILVYGNINLDVGIQDILYRQSNDYTNGLDTKEISLFAVLSSNKIFEDYAIYTHLGLGTGKIVQDSQLYISNPEQKIGTFFGFEFKTPLLKKNGGVSLLTEYDGMGLNIGLYIPILKIHQINIGITHFDDLGNFATEDKIGIDNYALLTENAPSITLGFTMKIPKVYSIYDERSIHSFQLGKGIYSKTDSSILFYNPICTEVVETLRDSIRVEKNIIENLEDHNIMLLHKEAVLVDSTRKNLLRKEVGQSQQNEAMRHLSRSLRFFYNERYRDALSEINSAIETNPNLAIAFGRRGSIYYKLGDIRRATMNWNAALQLDPEFTEIYDMLKAYDENSLISVEISK